MVAVIPLLTFSLLAALNTVYYARQHRRLGARRVPLHAVATRESVGRRIPALARIGRLGDAKVSDPIRAMVAIAAPGSATTAVEVFAADGSELAQASAHDIVMARGWSRGHLVVAFGETRREYGPSWALGPGMAGWEIQLVKADGTVLRCYGAPGSVVDEDLARLRARIQSAVLAPSS
jgi:hypothetical protein